MRKIKPKKLKSWEFVKDKPKILTTLKSYDDPSTYYYQFDGRYYYPAVAKIDFENVQNRKL